MLPDSETFDTTYVLQTQKTEPKIYFQRLAFVANLLHLILVVFFSFVFKRYSTRSVSNMLSSLDMICNAKPFLLIYAIPNWLKIAFCHRIPQWCNLIWLAYVCMLLFTFNRNRWNLHRVLSLFFPFEARKLRSNAIHWNVFVAWKTLCVRRSYAPVFLLADSVVRSWNCVVCVTT